jgi:hypothetical protein
VVEDRQATLHFSVEFSLSHPISIGSGDPECQATPSLLDPRTTPGWFR